MKPTDDEPRALQDGYRERLPAAPLRPHVACVWMHAQRHAAPRTVDVLPDGCMDILWRGDELGVAGPDTGPVRVPVPADARVVGVRFWPGAAPAWLGAPASALVDARPALAELWGREAARLAETLAEATSPAAIVAGLEAALLARLPEIARPDPLVCGVRAAAARAGGPAGSLADLAAALGVSERTLRRRCLDAFGYGPKTLERVLRFQRFVGLVQRAGPPRLAELAALAGYADQAHLARETRTLAGTTPRALVATLGRFVQDDDPDPRAPSHA